MRIFCYPEPNCSLKPRFENGLFCRHLLLWLSLPLIAIIVVIMTGQTERQPGWDTGYLDKEDKELFEKAISTVPQLNDPPKIAFMFLLRGHVPLEALWERFFQGNENRYTVYLHASMPGFDCNSVVNSSIFKDRQIPSVPIMWGGPNMVKAERRLIAAALADPSNHRFVLISEACLPIFNFSHIYDYLFAANHSYVTSHVSSWRYKDKMYPLIKRQQFRKGSQWLALIRDHAFLVVNDTVFYEKFLSTRAEIPDESYVQTMLPILDPKRVVPRGVEYVHWRYSTSRHPLTYGPTDITPDFLRAIQKSRNPPVETIGFLKMSRNEPCTVNGVPSHCFLFARKFAPNVVETIIQMKDVIGY